MTMMEKWFFDHNHAEVYTRWFGYRVAAGAIDGISHKDDVAVRLLHELRTQEGHYWQLLEPYKERRRKETNAKQRDRRKAKEQAHG